MKSLGKQYLVELEGCNVDFLDDPKHIEQLMEEAALAANATIVQQYFHQFSPFGVSGTIIIAESHINIHTWPEHSYAAVDIFSCGDSLKPEKAIKHLAKTLEAQSCETECLKRGLLKNTINK